MRIFFKDSPPYLNVTNLARTGEQVLILLNLVRLGAPWVVRLLGLVLYNDTEFITGGSIAGVHSAHYISPWLLPLEAVESEYPVSPFCPEAFPPQVYPYDRAPSATLFGYA